MEEGDFFCDDQGQVFVIEPDIFPMGVFRIGLFGGDEPGRWLLSLLYLSPSLEPLDSRAVVFGDVLPNFECSEVFLGFLGLIWMS